MLTLSGFSLRVFLINSVSNFIVHFGKTSGADFVSTGTVDPITEISSQTGVEHGDRCVSFSLLSFSSWSCDGLVAHA